jgi:hypothetical protein
MFTGCELQVMCLPTEESSGRELIAAQPHLGGQSESPLMVSSFYEYRAKAAAVCLLFFGVGIVALTATTTRFSWS